MTTYTWQVDSMYTLQTPDPDYVVIAMWTLTGVDGAVTASIQGNSTFNSQAEPQFIPYDQLTEDIVIGWVQTGLGPIGVSNFEANVQGQIDSINNPPVSPQNTPLPWSA